MAADSSKVSQATHPIGITTPLGTDVLLLEAFTGQEALSQPFNFRLDLLALKTATIAFDKLLGQKVTVRLNLPGNNQMRYFNGVVSRLTQGRELRGVEAQVIYVRYRMEIVPQFWMLTHRVQSRIFQQMGVDDILKKVLTGLDVSYQLQGTFQQRDYCTQYRESDFHFASRLMEDEGIYYYFKHTSSSHTMVVANTPQSNADVPGATTINYEDVLRRARPDERIVGWEKSQELRAGKVTLRDFCFEKPDDNLEAIRPVTETVQIGTVSHKLKVGGNDQMELYDFPGEYAGRFDGVDPGGGARAADLTKISPDSTRTATIRMAQETLAAVVIAGSSDCRQLASGCKFTLANHPNANGSYVLTRVDHNASIKGTYTTAEKPSMRYENTFQCIPFALPYAPPRLTPKARVEGTQTALVVGPSGQEIFTDKYSRVKVQFYWDRLGTDDANSSCWVRVGTLWAGAQWGMIHIPRVGHEVIVAFLEGDPDQPIIVGSVYNANNMPPYTLPANATQSGLKTRSSIKGTADNFNELRFEDKKGSELIFFHAEKDHQRDVENDDTITIGHDQTIVVKNNRTETVQEGNESITIAKGNRTETVAQGNESITISKGNRTVVVTKGNDSHQVDTGNREVIVKTGNDTHDVKTGNRSVTVDTGNDTHEVKTGNRSVTVDTGNDTHEIKTGNRTVKIDMGNDNLTISMGNQTTQLSLGKSSTTALQGIELTVGGNSIKIDQTGVTIQGLMVKINGQVQTQVQGLMLQLQGSAMTQIQGGITMIG